MDRTVKVKVTFSLILKLKEGADLETLLKKETEFLAEPKTANGVVLDMRLQTIETGTISSPCITGVV
jgi:hypothetical protein